jgi:phosphoglycolate phosphatase-like HAD superfamily hydrolase
LEKKGKRFVIITDLDGTIIDSDNGNFELLMKNLKQCGFDDKIDIILEGLVKGWDFDEIMEKIEMPPEIRKVLEAKVKDEINNQHFNLLPGVRHTLEQLHKLGFELSIVTDNYYGNALNCLEKTNISHYFEPNLIFGSDNFAYQKPSKDVVKEILKRSNRKFGIIIGNSSKEIAFAKNVGLPIILLENNQLKCLNGSVLKYYEKIKELGEQESYEKLIRVKNWNEVISVLKRLLVEQGTGEQATNQ